MFTPDTEKAASCVDVNEFRAAYGDASEGLLRDTVARMAVAFKGSSKHAAAVHRRRVSGRPFYCLQQLGQIRS